MSIEIMEVNKKFKNNKGNFNINISVKDNNVYGLIGPNGSGKTTLIRQIMAFVKSDSGKILIDGIDVWNNSEEFLNITGYIPGESYYFEKLNGLSYLKTCASLKNNIDLNYIKKLADYFEVDLNLKINKMSKGEKQKLIIINAFMGKPRYLILDEPTNGLDPSMQIKLINLITKFKEKYKATIILSSHMFDEIAQVCDKVGFIKDGKMLKEVELDNKDFNLIKKEFINLYSTENKVDEL